VVDEWTRFLSTKRVRRLIISGQAKIHRLYVRMNALPPLLEQQIAKRRRTARASKSGRLHARRKSASVFLTEQGHEKAERLLAEWGLIGEGESLYAAQNITLMHTCMPRCARTAVFRDQHYVVQANEVVIVDEFTVA